MAKGKYDLDDFRRDLRNLCESGPVRQMFESFLGQHGIRMPEDANPEQELRSVLAIVHSMTAEERADPDIVDRYRTRRIAQGAGVRPADVRKFIQSFDMMARVVRTLPNSSMMDLFWRLADRTPRGPFQDWSIDLDN